MDMKDAAFTKLLNAYPNSYDGGNMRALWTDTWAAYDNSVIVRTVDHVVRTWQRCPSLDEFMQQVAVEIERQNFVARKERMEACNKCLTGFIETKPDFFRPCEDCLPEGYEQWRSGNYEPTGL
jgi:hypothetical protein|tara:strand:+ start:1960 stop:2328 length:369 start_codon:yes stop_codon:yes gene_type:complete